MQQVAENTVAFKRKLKLLSGNHIRKCQLMKSFGVYLQRHISFFPEHERYGYPFISMRFDYAIKNYMFFEIHIACAIPFEDRFLGAPYDRYHLEIQSWKLLPFIEVLSFVVRKKLWRYSFESRRNKFNVDPYPVHAAGNGSGVVATMRN